MESVEVTSEGAANTSTMNKQYHVERIEFRFIKHHLHVSVEMSLTTGYLSRMMHLVTETRERRASERGNRPCEQCGEPDKNKPSRVQFKTI